MGKGEEYKSYVIAEHAVSEPLKSYEQACCIWAVCKANYWSENNSMPIQITVRVMYRHDGFSLYDNAWIGAMMMLDRTDKQGVASIPSSITDMN